MKLVWIGLGGAFGSVARYLVDGWVQRAAGATFPWGTLTVNAAGSFLLGLLMHVALARDALHSTLRIALTVGVLGGFTTYSTFNYETLGFLRERAWMLGGLNILATLLACLGAGALGLFGGRWLVGS